MCGCGILGPCSYTCGCSCHRSRVHYVPASAWDIAADLVALADVQTPADMFGEQP